MCQVRSKKGELVGNTNQSSVPVRRPDHLFIDGRWVRPHSDSTIDVSDSTTGGHYFSVVEADETDVSRAVAAALAVST